nr:MAG TPA: hypothetical protein [Caudoviricetes sp.]DAU49050.1 MAG TPA: hypothetical protein [Caudoviricetes sp.]DAV25592.1 MAG TPA: hypothetical protein [Caudoviricetes sp.]
MGDYRKIKINMQATTLCGGFLLPFYGVGKTGRNGRRP